VGVHYTGEMNVKSAQFLVACHSHGGQQPSKNPSPFKLTVTDIKVGNKFQAYVGGGTNIEPPAPFGGGGGIPSISMSGGATFLAGEISSKSDKVKLVRVEFTVENSGHAPASFKIGDVGLTVGSEKLNDFLAVGYVDRLCAMSDADRKKVKEIVETVPPAGLRLIVVAFPVSADAKHGELRLGNSTPVPLEF